MEDKKPGRTIKDLVNTPFKRFMFGIQILSYVLIVGSPAIGGGIGGVLKLTSAQTGWFILVVFIVGEVLFYGSLFFLGKEVVMLVKEKVWGKFKKRKEE